MPSNNTGKVVIELAKKYPGKVGLCQTPKNERWWQTKFMPYICDNGCFSQFDEKAYLRMLEKIISTPYPLPIFVTIPDVVGCHTRTRVLWNHYAPMISDMGFKMAFVAQDGCSPEDVPHDAYAVFVGGLDPWKDQNIERFIGVRKWTHVGRVNGWGRLKACKALGVDSVDGSGLWAMNYEKFIQTLEGEKQGCLF